MIGAFCDDESKGTDKDNAEAQRAPSFAECRRASFDCDPTKGVGSSLKMTTFVVSVGLFGMRDLCYRLSGARAFRARRTVTAFEYLPS